MRRRQARKQGWAKPGCCAAVEHPRMAPQSDGGGRVVRKAG